jgi:hypothetical protein
MRSQNGLRTLLIGLALFIGFSGVFALLVFQVDGFISTDDYYHARIAAEIIQQRRLAVDFQWLPQTILSPEQFVDHHLLFHLYVAPWSYWGSMNGAKLAAVSLASAVVTAVWFLLRQMRVSTAALWTLTLVAVSSPFVYRLLMVRAQGMALLVLLIALLVLFSGRHRWLIVIAFAFTWLYNGFVLMLGVAAAYTIAVWLSDHRLDLRPLLYAALGIGLGLVINPYFPRNIVFIIEHLGAKVDLENSVRVGNEWYPYTTAGLLENSGGALIALAIGLILPGITGRRRDRHENTLLLVALLTLYMTLESRRFIEYFPAFAALFGVVALARSAHELAPFLPTQFKSLAVPRFILPVVALLLIVGTVFNLRGTTNMIANAPDVAYLAGAAAWLEDNTAAGTMVFQTDWDDFTRLFFHNTHNNYLIGLDPTYLQIANTDLWNQWTAITQGKVSDPSEIIRTAFAANYVVSDTHHGAFEQKAEADPNMRLVYRDRYNLIWEIIPHPLTMMGAT